MTRGKAKQTSTKTAVAHQNPPVSARSFIAMAGFLLVATVLVARPLISESYRAIELSFLNDMQIGAGPSASLTAWLDFILLLGAAAMAFGVRRRAMSAIPLAGFLAIIVAVAVSTYAADDKRLALNAGFTLIAFAACGVIALAQRWRQQLIVALLAGVCATGVTFAVKCYLQVHSEFPELIRQWDAQAATESPDAPYRADRVNFERRLRAMEPFGYQSHSNVAGSFLAMWGLLALGIVASLLVLLRNRVHVRDDAHAPQAKPEESSQLIAIAAIFALLVGVFVWTLVLTGSFGAVVAGVLGFLTFAALLHVYRDPKVSRRKALIVILTPYLVLIVLGATIGLSRGTLPHSSMAFRWGYWQGAARVFVEEPLRGIGRENFGNRYLHAKNITSPEDVKDPHNFWISMLVELGPLGFTACAMLVVAGLWTALPRPNDLHNASSSGVGARWPMFALAFATLALLLATNKQVFLVQSMWIVWLTDIGFPWLSSYAFFCWIMPRLMNFRANVCVIALGAVAAAIAMLYHNLVSFSLLVPGGLGLFLAALIVAHGMQQEPSNKEEHQGLNRTVGIFVGLPIVMCLFVLLPTLRGERALAGVKAAIRANLGRDDSEALQHVAERAVDVDPLSAQLSRDAAQLLYADATRADDATAGTRLLTAARSLALEAENRNRNSRQTQILLANIAFTQSLATKSTPLKIAYLRESFVHRKRAAAFAPYDARGQIALAEVGTHLWQTHGDAEARDLAMNAIDQAMESDAAREVQDASRLQAAELARVEELRAVLKN